MSFGEDAQHDWAWLLARFGLLPYDLRFAASLRAMAAVVWLGSVLFGGWLCVQMASRAAAGAGSERT